MSPHPYLAVFDGLPEEVVQEQAGQLWVLVKGLLDVSKEDTADDATSTPHESDGAIVETPAVALGCLLQQHEALGIADNLGGIQGLSEGRRSVGKRGREGKWRREGQKRESWRYSESSLQWSTGETVTASYIPS